MIFQSCHNHLPTSACYQVFQAGWDVRNSISSGRPHAPQTVWLASTMQQLLLSSTSPLLLQLFCNPSRTALAAHVSVTCLFFFPTIMKEGPSRGQMPACGRMHPSETERDALWTHRRIRQRGRHPPSHRCHLIGSAVSGAKVQKQQKDWSGQRGQNNLLQLQPAASVVARGPTSNVVNGGQRIGAFLS